MLRHLSQSDQPQFFFVGVGETILGQPSRRMVLWEPDVRTIRHPIRCSAASARRALVAGQSLMRLWKTVACRVRAASLRARFLRLSRGGQGPWPLAWL